MKTITLRQFRKSPTKFRDDYKVTEPGGSFWKIRYFSANAEDGGTRIPITTKDYNYRRGNRCGICGNVKRVVFVVPFDLRVVPGFYCYKCRRKLDLMDVKIARKHGKV